MQKRDPAEYLPLPLPAKLSDVRGIPSAASGHESWPRRGFDMMEVRYPSVMHTHRFVPDGSQSSSEFGTWPAENSHITDLGIRSHGVQVGKSQNLRSQFCRSVKLSTEQVYQITGTADLLDEDETRRRAAVYCV